MENINNHSNISKSSSGYLIPSSTTLAGISRLKKKKENASLTANIKKNKNGDNKKHYAMNDDIMHV